VLARVVEPESSHTLRIVEEAPRDCEEEGRNGQHPHHSGDAPPSLPDAERITWTHLDDRVHDGSHGIDAARDSTAGISLTIGRCGAQSNPRSPTPMRAVTLARRRRRSKSATSPAGVSS